MTGAVHQTPASAVDRTACNTVFCITVKFISVSVVHCIVYQVLYNMAFICDECQTSFTRSNNLRRHRLLYHHALTPVGVPSAPVGVPSAPAGVPSAPAGVPSAPAGVPIHPAGVAPVPERTVKLQHPFSMLLCGPTGCGKTSLLKKMLEHNMIEPAPHYIVWYYKIWQPLYEEMQHTIPNIYFKEGLPSNEELREHAERPRLFVLDDLMSAATESPEVCGMFTEGSHHYNYSVCCLIQNLFYKARLSRTISLNAKYIVLFKSPRDSQQAAILAKQMFPTATEKLMKPYTEVTMKPFGYLFIDLSQTTAETERIVKNLFPMSISVDDCIGSTNTIMNYTQFEAKRQK